MNKSKGLAGDPPGAWREVVDAEGGLGVGDGALEAGGRVLGLRVQLHGVARLQPPRVARLEIELETKVHNGRLEDITLQPYALCIDNPIVCLLTVG